MNDDAVTTVIICELISVAEGTEITNAMVVSWTKRVECTKGSNQLFGRILKDKKKLMQSCSIVSFRMSNNRRNGKNSKSDTQQAQQ